MRKSIVKYTCTALARYAEVILDNGVNLSTYVYEDIEANKWNHCLLLHTNNTLTVRVNVREATGHIV
jgi:hypothetical protein